MGNKNELLLMIFEKLSFDLKSFIDFINSKQKLKVSSMNKKIYSEYIVYSKLKKKERLFFLNEINEIYYILSLCKINININPSDSEIDFWVLKIKKKSKEIKSPYLKNRLKTFFLAIETRRENLKNVL